MGDVSLLHSWLDLLLVISTSPNSHVVSYKRYAIILRSYCSVKQQSVLLSVVVTLHVIHYWVYVNVTLDTEEITAVKVTPTSQVFTVHHTNFVLCI